MRSFLRILAGLLEGSVVGPISFVVGIPMAVPATIGGVLFAVTMYGTFVSEEMRGRDRVYVIAAFGVGLALSALIAANPH